MSLTSFGSTGQYLFGAMPLISDNLDFETPFGLANNSVTSISYSFNNTTIIPKWTCAGTMMAIYNNKSINVDTLYDGTQIVSFNGTTESMSMIHDGVLLQAGTYVIDYYVGSAGNGVGGMGVTVSYSINGGTTWILRSTKATPYFAGATQKTTITAVACKVTSSSFTIATETLVQLKIATISEGTSVTGARTAIKNFSFRAI